MYEDEVADRCLEVDLQDALATRPARAIRWRDVRGPAASRRLAELRGAGMGERKEARPPRGSSARALAASVVAAAAIIVALLSTWTGDEDRYAQGKAQSIATLLDWLGQSGERGALAEAELRRRGRVAIEPLLEVVTKHRPTRAPLPRRLLRAVRVLRRLPTAEQKALLPLLHWSQSWMGDKEIRSAVGPSAYVLFDTLFALGVRLIQTDPGPAAAFRGEALSQWFHENNGRAKADPEDVTLLRLEEAMARVLLFEPEAPPSGDARELCDWAEAGRLTYLRCARWLGAFERAGRERDSNHRKIWRAALVEFLERPATARVNVSGRVELLMPAAARALVAISPGAPAAHHGHRVLLRCGDIYERLAAARALLARPVTVSLEEANVLAGLRSGWPPLVQESVTLLGSLRKPPSKPAVAAVSRLVSSQHKGIAAVAQATLRRWQRNETRK